MLQRLQNQDLKKILEEEKNVAKTDPGLFCFWRQFMNIPREMLCIFLVYNLEMVKGYIFQGKQL